MDNNIFMHTPHTIIMIDTINHYFKILIFSPYFHIHISSIVSRILYIVFVIWVQVLWLHLAVAFSKFILMYNAQSPFFLFRPLVCLRNQTLVLYNLLHLGLTKGFLVVSPPTSPLSLLLLLQAWLVRFYSFCKSWVVNQAEVEMSGNTIKWITWTAFQENALCKLPQQIVEVESRNPYSLQRGCHVLQ